MALVRDCPPKPEKGTVWREGREKRAARKSANESVMAEAKRRDVAITGGCRWPRCEFMRKKPRIDCAHVVIHRGMGGDPKGLRTQRHELMALCVVHHARVDTGRADVRPQTDQGTDGPCDFYVESESGRMELVASEQRIGVSTERSVR